MISKNRSKKSGEKSRPSTKTAQETNKILARVPQDMAFDTDAMVSQFQRHAGLIRDVFMFVVRHQFTARDVFNNINFTVEDFCKEMGYSKQELYRRLEIWNNKLTPPKLVDGHECDGLFEYALYRATTEKVIFHRRSKDGNPIINTYEIFKSLEIIYDRTTKKTTKRTYSVILSSDVLNAAFARFFVLDYNDYRALAAKSSDATGSYRNFYVFFARMVAITKSGKQHTYITTVNELASVFNYDSSDPRHLKQSVKRALDRIQEKIKHPYSYKFISDPNSANKSKLQYHVLFSFSDELLIFYEERLVAYFWSKLREKAYYSYSHTLGKKADGYVEKSNIDQEDFHKWWFSTAEKEEKEQMIQSLLKEIFPGAI
jgi:hypothetical protein